MGVEHKVNRHVLKALRCLSQGDCAKKVPVGQICQLVQHQMRNLVPVPNIKAAVKTSLQNLSKIGIIEKRKRGRFCFGSALSTVEIIPNPTPLSIQESCENQVPVNLKRTFERANPDELEGMRKRPRIECIQEKSRTNTMELSATTTEPPEIVEDDVINFKGPNLFSCWGDSGSTIDQKYPQLSVDKIESGSNIHLKYINELGDAIESGTTVYLKGPNQLPEKINFNSTVRRRDPNLTTDTMEIESSPHLKYKSLLMNKIERSLEGLNELGGTDPFEDVNVSADNAASMQNTVEAQDIAFLDNVKDSEQEL